MHNEERPSTRTFFFLKKMKKARVSSGQPNSGQKGNRWRSWGNRVRLEGNQRRLEGNRRQLEHVFGPKKMKKILVH